LSHLKSNDSANKS